MLFILIGLENAINMSNLCQATQAPVRKERKQQMHDK